MALSIETFDREKHAQLIAPLTELLHAAYKPLADQGLRYLASHQDEGMTLKRLSQGQSFLAFFDGDLAGTIYLHPSKPDHPCVLYRAPQLFFFGQFAVRVDLQGRGIARALLDHVEGQAREQGGKTMALDTAEGASALIAWYARRGYKQLGYMRWDATNYRSVVMGKPLR